jgi:hypothetical protein
MEWSALTCSFCGAPPELAFGSDHHRRGGSDDHAGEDEESCRVRRRYHVVGQPADRGIETGVEDRHQQHAAAGPVVQLHQQCAGEEQRDEPDREDYRSRDELLNTPAFLGEMVGHMPERPQQSTYTVSFIGWYRSCQ